MHEISATLNLPFKNFHHNENALTYRLNKLNVNNAIFNDFVIQLNTYCLYTVAVALQPVHTQQTCITSNRQ